ncbi:MAG: lytic transglycosylase domain-containing protein [Rickettsiales bacterium]
MKLIKLKMKIIQYKIKLMQLKINSIQLKNFFKIIKIVIFTYLISNLNYSFANSDKNVDLILNGKYHNISTSKSYIKKFALSEQYLNDKNANIEDIMQFIKENPVWLTKIKLLNKIEHLIDDNTALDLIFNWFNSYPPKTNNGKKYYFTAKLAFQKEFSIQDVNFLINTWIKANFNEIEIVNAAKKINNLTLIQNKKNPNIKIFKFAIKKNKKANLIDEKILHEKVARLISSNYLSSTKKIDLNSDFAKILIVHKEIINNKSDYKYWQEYTNIAKKMRANKFNPQKPQDGKNKIKEIAYNANINIFQNLNAKLKNNGNIIFLYLNNHYKYKQDITAEVEKLILLANKYQELHNEWWDIINCYARELIIQNQFSRALALVNSIQINKEQHPKIVEAQTFLQGFLNYKLDKFDRAAKFFDYGFIITKHTRYKAKFSYWSGLMYKKMNNIKQANDNFKIASEYGFTFYGQVASHELGINLNLKESRPDNKNLLSKQYKNIKDCEKVLKLILNSNAKLKIKANMLVNFLENFGNDLDAKLYFYHKFAKYNNNYINVVAGNAIMNIHNTFLRNSYPMPYNNINSFVKHEFLYSIIRQESEFNLNVIAHDGGMGLMQIMSYTGIKLAQELKVKYEPNKLTSDAEYAIKLGSFYLFKNLKLFDNNTLLASYAYNAGENKVSNWLCTLGNLKNIHEKIKILEWTEKVTFNITRWYGQRVMENFYVYQYLLNKLHNKKQEVPLNILFK